MLFKIEGLSLRGTFLRVGKSIKVLGRWDWMGKGFGVFLLLLVWFFFSCLVLGYEALCIAACMRGFACAEELLSQRQALLWASGPLGFCRARSQHHKGKTRHFASVKGTSSHISNIAALEAFHRDWMILLFSLFPLSVFEHCCSQYCLVWERKDTNRVQPLRGTHSKTSAKSLEVYGMLKKRHRFGDFYPPTHNSDIN